MPFYAADTELGRHLSCINSDTDEEIKYVSWADTDKGQISVYETDPENNNRIKRDEDGRLVRVIKNVNIYVKDLRTGEINPPSLLKNRVLED